MASGLTGSAFFASANQAANSRTGSSASVKSPPVNHAGCSIEAVSDMLRKIHVLAWGNRHASAQSPYSNRSGRLRLSLMLAAAVAVLCGLAVGGCSFQLHSLLAKDDADGDQTGSIGRAGAQVAAATDTAQPLEADLAYARAAAAEVVAHGGKDSSVPWRNPEDGAGGNIT